ncbi:MAG: hypothetical protein ABI675_07400 [Chitinophagaceae bacterium]
MKLIYLSLCFLITTICSFGQFNMPSFKDVVTTFYSKYTFNGYDSYLKFQRKKDGWYVSEDAYGNPGNFFNTKLFWSKETKKYTELEYPVTTADTGLVTDKVDKYLVQINWTYEEYQYQRNKYYGYPGWDWDIINDEKSQTNLTDSLLESQGRANFNYASGYIAEQFGDLFVNNDSDRIPLKASDKISKSRIEKFIFFELKAINAYSEILKLNPGYETRVGNIKIKLANEYMFSYLELLMAGDLVKAKEFAKKAEYPDSLLLLSKSYLSALPENGILITGGDNDTYPLWYLQKVENFRTDISVLNYNLIGFRKYLALVNQDKNQPLFKVKDSIYLKNDFDYFLFGNQTGDSIQIDVGTFLKHLKNNYNPYDTSVTLYKGGTIKKYYAKQLYFVNNNKQKSKQLTLPATYF